MDAPSNEADALQQEIMHSLNRMRIDAETANQKTLEEMTDYYTMWAHQIKTPIFALRLLLQENPTVNKEALTELFKIEQYVEMVLGYLRTEDMSSDLKLSRCNLDTIIRRQIHKYAGIFVSKKLSLTYKGISESVLTDARSVIMRLVTFAGTSSYRGVYACRWDSYLSEKCQRQPSKFR